MAFTRKRRDALSPVERQLVDSVERGTPLDLARDQPVDEPAMRGWGPSQTVRAWVVRDLLRGRLAQQPDPHGVRLRGARVAGRLDLDNITSTVPLEFHDCLLDEGLTASDANLAALTFADCRIEHPDRSALYAVRLTTTMLNLRRTTITANDPFAAVFLAGGHLGGLICDGARLHNESGPALYADRLRADHGVYLRAGFEATGTGQYGAVRLLNAHFASLECDGARIRNDAGPALYADELRVDNGMLLNAGFEAVDAGVLGAVNLRGAHLGSLYCGGAELRNESGPALLAARLRVDQDVFLRDGFVAVGAGERGAVNVIGAHFGELACSGAKLGNQSGPALIATRLRIDHKLYFDEVEALGGGDSVAVYLTDVHIGGAFVFNPTRLAHNTNPHARIDVDGLVYTGLPHGIVTSEWLLLLAAGTPDYAAQPYQQLAAAHRAAGHDSQARRILMTQRRDQIHRRAITGRAERVWARFTGLALGYGYQPWRALIGLLVVVASAVTLAVILGDHGALTQVPARAAPTSSACTMVERVGVGLDLGVPLISTGSSARCQAADSATGQILTTTGWVLRLLAWAFATLFIAGFTGAVRKT